MIQAIRKFIFIQEVQAWGILCWALVARFEAHRQISLSFSSRELQIIAAIVSVILPFVYLLNRVRKSEHLVGRIAQRLEGVLIRQRQLIPALVGVTLLTGMILFAILKILSTPLDYDVYSTWAPDFFPTIYAITLNLLPFLSMFLAAFAGVVGLLLFLYKKCLADPHFWEWKAISPGITIIVIVLLTLAHWFILALQLKVFVIIPAWYWENQYKPFSITDLVYIVVAGILIYLAARLSWTKGRNALCLVIFFVAGLFLQISLGVLAGGNFAGFKDRYLTTYHASYLELASNNDAPIVENLRNYEDIFGRATFARTKPPGLMAGYLMLERLVNGNPLKSSLTDDARFERLSSTIALIFPILGAAAIFLIYFFARSFLFFHKPWQEVLPSSLYIVTPNIILFPLFADQAIYPALFLSGCWLIFVLFRKNAIIASFSLGFLLYCFAYFAFTMLPLFPLAGMFLLLQWYHSKTEFPLVLQLKKGLIFLAGIVGGYWLLRLLLNYDFFTRFTSTMNINHKFDFYTRVGIQAAFEGESIATRLKQIIQALLINNIEFATTVGVGIFLLFAIFGIRLLIQLIKRRLGENDIYPGSMFLAFIILNLTGSVQGEVGRLWMFWVPMVVLFASRQLIDQFHGNKILLIIMMDIQLLNTLFLFHFQDLLM